MSGTRAKLIRAARTLFHEQGYAATGVATIQREAGIKPGSFYHFFPGKEALLEAVLDDYMTALMPEVVEPATGGVADPLEKILALMNFYREALIHTGFGFGCPLGNLALEVGQEPGTVTQKIDANFRQWRDVVKGWLDSPEFGLPEGVSADDVAVLTLTIMEGAVMQARTAKSIAPYDASVREFRRYLEMLRKTGRP
jgi:TetR/AcrR family transcriptional regulator, transcriptional repressor for nem operon